MNLSKRYQTALVFGAGAFGTALGTVLANNFEKVILFTNEKEAWNNIKTKNENTGYFPGKLLASNIDVALSWEEIEENKVGNVEIMVFGLPSTAILGFLHEHYERILSLLDKKVPAVSLAKGIDPITLELADELFFSYYHDYSELFTFLSGPSFASEIVDKHITAVSLAGHSTHILEKTAAMLDTPYFKTLACYDIKGVLLGGALKNVLAIGGGIIEGLGFRNNTRAAMITRGIAEMLRFGTIFNARPETFYGLSGMGDLILTTTGELSRNKRLGLEIAKGRKASEVIRELKTTVEGFKTAKAAHALSEKHNIRASIFNGVYDVLYEDVPPHEVLEKLMKTQTRFEIN